MSDPGRNNRLLRADVQRLRPAARRYRTVYGRGLRPAQSACGGRQRRVHCVFRAYGTPGERVEVKHAIAEGHCVVLHCFQHRPGGEDHTGIDIFRLDGNGEIVEHRDVRQAMPEHSANPDGLFQRALDTVTGSAPAAASMEGAHYARNVHSVKSTTPGKPRNHRPAATGDSRAALL